MVPAILYADRRPKPVLVAAVAVLFGAEALLGRIDAGIAGIAAPMLAFFVAFNVLEALLPSLVSRLAPAEGRGVAIGVYNTTQTLGVFFGGVLGGWVARLYGTTAVFGVCAALVVLWLLIALGMRPLQAVNEASRAAL
jgi:predicted MFS family arabinose efflux permease